MSSDPIVIELVTTGYVYGAADEITLRTSLDDWEENDIEATEINDSIWKFELSDAKYLNFFEFKFVNFPAIVDKDINPYKDIFREKPRVSSSIQNLSEIIQDLSRIGILRILIAIIRGLLKIPIAIIQDLFKIVNVIINLVLLGIKMHFQPQEKRKSFKNQIKQLIDKIEPPKKLDKSEQREYHNKLKSVSLGWENTHLRLINNTPKKNLILPNIFPFIYFFLPSVLLILVYPLKAIDFDSFSFANFRTFYFSDWQGFRDFLPIFLLEGVPFLVDLYLLYVFWTYWRQSIQTRNTLLALFWNDN